MEKALTMSPELLLSTLKSNLAEMQERLKELQKLGNKDAEIQARVEIEEAKKNIKELEKEIQAS
jgi:phage-related protein